MRPDAYCRIPMRFGLPGHSVLGGFAATMVLDVTQHLLIYLPAKGPQLRPSFSQISPNFLPLPQIGCPG